MLEIFFSYMTGNVVKDVFDVAYNILVILGDKNIIVKHKMDTSRIFFIRRKSIRYKGIWNLKIELI